MFLKTLGIIFVIILLIVAYYGFKFYRFIKREMNSDLSLAMAALPDQDLELEPSNSQEWKEQEQLDFVENQLKKIGASHSGYYCVYGEHGTIRVSLWDFRSQQCVVIYEAFANTDEKQVSFIYEVACKLDDGSVCISSNPLSELTNKPAKHKTVFNESKSVLDFLKAMKDEIPEGKKVLKITDVKEYFIESYEEESAWAWEEDQIKSDNTQQVMATLGAKVDDDILDQLIEMGKDYAVQVNVNNARRKLANHSSMSVAQWEKIRDNLVFVNENMRVDDLVGAIYDLTGDLTENQEQVIDGFQENTDELIDPIGAFQLLIKALNLNVKRLTKMQSPVITEVYLPL